MDKSAARVLAASLLRIIADDLVTREETDEEVSDFLSLMSRLFEQHGCNDLIIEEVLPEPRDRLQLLNDFLNDFATAYPNVDFNESVEKFEVWSTTDYKVMKYAAGQLWEVKDEDASL